ncbi:hypothetical protein CsatB_006240 [Cannabis sativa]
MKMGKKEDIQVLIENKSEYYIQISVLIDNITRRFKIIEEISPNASKYISSHHKYKYLTFHFGKTYLFSGFIPRGSHLVIQSHNGGKLFLNFNNNIKWKSNVNNKITKMR